MVGFEENGIVSGYLQLKVRTASLPKRVTLKSLLGQHLQNILVLFMIENVTWNHKNIGIKKFVVFLGRPINKFVVFSMCFLSQQETLRWAYCLIVQLQINKYCVSEFNTNGKYSWNSINYAIFYKNIYLYHFVNYCCTY